MKEQGFSRRDLFRIGGQTAAGLVAAEVTGKLGQAAEKKNKFTPCLQFAETGTKSESGLHIGTVLFEDQRSKDRKADYLEPMTFKKEKLSQNDPYYHYKLLRYKDAGEELDLGIPKHYIDIGPSRGVPGQIVEPNAIVVHTTQIKEWHDNPNIPAYRLYQSFQNQSGNEYGAATHFAVDREGGAVQMAELFKKGVRRTYGCASYPATIGIEMFEMTVFESKREVPKAQYDKTMYIIEESLKHYDLPIGSHDASWRSRTDIHMKNFRPGVYGHYQLNPFNKTDPGAGLMRDILKDLRTPKDTRTHH